MSTSVLTPPPLSPPPPPDFDLATGIQNARQAGHSDDVILNRIRTIRPEMGSKIDAVLAETGMNGEKYTPTQIVDSIHKKSQSIGFAPVPVQPKEQSLTDGLLHATGFGPETSHEFAPEFDKRALSNSNPWEIIKSIGKFPTTGYAQDSQVRGQILQQAVQDFQTGNYGSSAIHAAAGAIPVLGPAIAEFGQALMSKDPGRIGRASADLVTLRYGPEFMKATGEAVLPRAASGAAKTKPYVAPTAGGFIKGALKGAATHGTQSTILGGAAGALLNHGIEGVGGGSIVGMGVPAIIEGTRGAIDAAKKVSKTESLKGGKLTPQQQNIINARWNLKDQFANAPTPDASAPETELPPPPDPALPSKRVPGNMANAPVPPPAPGPLPPIWQGITDQPAQPDQPVMTPPPSNAAPTPATLPNGRKVGGIHNQKEMPPPPAAPATEDGKPVKPTTESIVADFMKRTNMTNEDYDAMPEALQEEFKKRIVAEHKKKMSDNDIKTQNKDTTKPAQPAPSTQPAPQDAPAVSVQPNVQPDAVMTPPPGTGTSPGPGTPISSTHKTQVKVNNWIADKKVNLINYWEHHGITPDEAASKTLVQKNAMLRGVYDHAVKQGRPVPSGKKYPATGYQPFIEENQSSWDEAVDDYRAKLKGQMQPPPQN